MSTKILMLLLSFALFVAVIEARHRCCPDDDCDDDDDDCCPRRCQCPCSKKKCKTTTENPETEPPTTTTPVLAVVETKCNAKYTVPACKHGKCTNEHIGTYCCCGDSQGKWLSDQSSKCHSVHNNTECSAIHVRCHGCDSKNLCVCKEGKAPSTSLLSVQDLPHKIREKLEKACDELAKAQDKTFEHKWTKSAEKKRRENVRHVCEYFAKVLKQSHESVLSEWLGFKSLKKGVKTILHECSEDPSLGSLIKKAKPVCKTFLNFHEH